MRDGLIGLILLTTACATNGGSDGDSSGAAFVVEAKDGWFQTRVPALPSSRVVALEDNSYGFTFDNDGSVPVSCEVIPGDVPDPPLALREGSTILFSLLAEELGSIASKRVADIEAGSIGRAPYMAVEWAFEVDSPKGRLPGLLNIRYAVKDEAGIVCYKLDGKARDEFHADFEVIVENFKLAVPVAEPTFIEINRTSIRGHPVGVSVNTIQIDEEGYSKDEQLLHFLMPETQDSLTAITEYQYEWVRPAEWTLINAGRLRIRDGERDHDIALQRSEQTQRWTVTGTSAGKDVEFELGGDNDPTTSLFAHHAVRDALLAADPLKPVVELQMWNDDDPAKLLEATLRITELIDAKRARSVLEFESYRGESIIERATARALVTTVQMGESVLEVERLVLEGEP